jgi:hypothetical protein
VAACYLGRYALSIGIPRDSRAGCMRSACESRMDLVTYIVIPHRKRESRISSVRSLVNGRVIGQPDLDSRVIAFRRVFSSAVESIFYNSCDLEREVRVESRSERVEARILNA